jgi:hypothetical protein
VPSRSSSSKRNSRTSCPNKRDSCPVRRFQSVDSVRRSVLSEDSSVAIAPGEWWPLSFTAGITMRTWCCPFCRMIKRTARRRLAAPVSALRRQKGQSTAPSPVRRQHGIAACNSIGAISGRIFSRSKPSAHSQDVLIPAPRYSGWVASGHVPHCAARISPGRGSDRCATPKSMSDLTGTGAEDMSPMPPLLRPVEDRAAASRLEPFRGLGCSIRWAVGAVRRRTRQSFGMRSLRMQTPGFPSGGGIGGAR